MEIRLFKTKKLAEAYIRENYPNRTLRNTSMSDRDDYDARDMPALCWSGDVPAWLVEDENLNTLAYIGYWEDGDDEYELFIGGNPSGVFDNIYDAREAYKRAVETEEYKDEEEEEVFEVKLLCNGEDISE